MTNPRPRFSAKYRQEQIQMRLKLDSTVRILTLAREFGVTTETIRRDLDALAKKGLIERTYGGAAPKPPSFEPEIRERQRRHVTAREQIAKAAVTFVEDGDALMIDSGSTTIAFALQLAQQALTLKVVTNCFAVAAALAANDRILTLFCPGTVLAREGGVVGPDAIEFLRRFQVNKAFIGASGLLAEGPMEAQPAGAALKRVMIDRAEKAFLLLDASKYEKSYFERVYPLDEIYGVISEAAPNERLNDALKQAGVRLFLA